MQSHRNQLVSLLVGGFLVIALVMSFALWVILNQKADAKNRAEIATANLSKIIADNFGYEIRQIDYGIMDVLDELARQQTASQLDRDRIVAEIARQETRHPETIGFGVFGPDGKLRYSAHHQSDAKVDVSARDYFQYLRNSNDNTLVTSPPVQSILGGGWIIALARRITNPDGSFGGVVTAPISLQALTETLSNLKLGQGGIVTIYHDSFVLAGRVPETEKYRHLIGTVTISDRVRSLITTGIATAQNDTTSPIDGVNRTTNFRRIEGQPYSVIVGLSEDDYLADWRISRNNILLFTAFVVVLVLAGMFAKYQRIKDRQDLLAELSLAATAFESADGVRVTDDKGMILRVNRAFTEITGYTAQETVGQTYRLLMSDLHDKEFFRAVQASLDATGKWQGEIWSRRKTGEVYPEWLTVSAIRNADGVLTHYVCTHFDISERKAVEKALLDSQARLQSIFDASPDALLISDAQGMIVMANQRCERLLGYLQEELLGQSVEVLVPGHFRKSHPALRRNYAAGKDSNLMAHGRTVQALRKDGSECDVEISLALVNVEQGLFIASALRDISERQRAEAALRQSEEKLRSLYELSPLGIALTDMKGRFIEFNESFRRICGYEAEELKALDYWTLTPRKFEADEARQLASLKAKGQYGPYEKEYVRKDGVVVPLRLSGVMVGGHDGQNYIWSIVEDVTESLQAKNKIHELAFFDRLTGIPNRALLLDRMRLALFASSRNGTYGALLYVDLDNFKTFNDTLGHEKGDLLLKQVAERLTNCVRDDDTVARSGGDEFQVMLVGLSHADSDAATQVEAIGEKILTALSQPYLIDGTPHHCTASIGATLFQGQVATEDLFKQADLALHRAKGAGRRNLRFFDPEMEKAVMTRAWIEAELRHALDQKQFLLHYQPQVISDGRITGAEVLVRWSHPERGMVSPADFIPSAEETGLILPLGNWVLETACKQLAEWASQPDLADLKIAVNVSAHQFRQPDFVDGVLKVIANTGANPERLKLELTESLLVNNVQEIIGKMQVLKGHGVKFSLDDFGTGYSSLSYLKRLPLDQLKIDQSFVRDVLTDPNDAAIAKTVVALSDSLGLGVIAEGVETEAQRDFLAGSGCHAYQGYFYSRPLPLEGFEQFVRQN